MTQNIQGHLRYTLRLIERAIEESRDGAPGAADVEVLRRIERLLRAEFLRQRKREAYEEVRHPLGDLIEGWPPQDALTVALQAVVDHAWRPVEFGTGGRFSFPNPDDA